MSYANSVAEQQINSGIIFVRRGGDSCVGKRGREEAREGGEECLPDG